jgi:dTDP-4-dehydrorhamnose reductase
MVTADPSRVLILGAGGTLGRELVARMRGSYRVIVRTRAQCDITRAGELLRLLDQERPQIVINAAAYTDVDRAEREQEQAWAINAVAPAELAVQCATRAIQLVHYSTDYIFDGQLGRPYLESDPPHPLSVYGHSKLAGEQAVLTNHPTALVLRAAWLYGAAGRNYASTMARRLLVGETIACECDRLGNPTWAGTLALLTESLLQREAQGIFHVSCGGATSWHGFARELARRMRVNDIERRVTAVPSAVLQRAATRPANSVLASERLAEFGLAQPPWQVGLVSYLATLPLAPL